MFMTRMPVTFNPTDPAFLQNPYPTYKRLRDESPIFFYEPWGKWVLTHHSDVSALLRDPRLGRVLTNVKVLAVGANTTQSAAAAPATDGSSTDAAAAPAPQLSGVLTFEVSQADALRIIAARSVSCSRIRR